jgi:hypothetical protein
MRVCAHVCMYLCVCMCIFLLVYRASSLSLSHTHTHTHTHTRQSVERSAHKRDSNIRPKVCSVCTECGLSSVRDCKSHFLHQLEPYLSYSHFTHAPIRSKSQPPSLCLHPPQAARMHRRYVYIIIYLCALYMLIHTHFMYSFIYSNRTTMSLG